MLIMGWTFSCTVILSSNGREYHFDTVYHLYVHVWYKLYGTSSNNRIYRFNIYIYISFSDTFIYIVLYHHINDTLKADAVKRAKSRWTKIYFMLHCIVHSKRNTIYIIDRFWPDYSQVNFIFNKSGNIHRYEVVWIRPMDNIGSVSCINLWTTVIQKYAILE